MPDSERISSGTEQGWGPGTIERFDQLLTKRELDMIRDFRNKMKNIKKENEVLQLINIKKLLEEYIKKGMRINSRCENTSGDIEDPIVNKIESVMGDLSWDSQQDAIKDIIETLIKSGCEMRLKQKICEKLPNFESCISEEKFKEHQESFRKAVKGSYEENPSQEEMDVQKSFRDNRCFYAEYPEGYTVDVQKITDKCDDLKGGLIEIGKNRISVEMVGGKRNYTGVDTQDGRPINITFATLVGEITICLTSTNEGKVKVKVDENSKEALAGLEMSSWNPKRLFSQKYDSSLGKGFLLGGESVSEVLAKGFFKKTNFLIKYEDERNDWRGGIYKIAGVTVIITLKLNKLLRRLQKTLIEILDYGLTG